MAAGNERERFDRLAPVYDLLLWPLERLVFSRWRRRVMARVQGRTLLDVGTGTGVNMRYYPEDTVVCAVDVSRGMLGRAGKRSPSVCPGACDRVNLFQMDVQHLAFAASTFDTVLATFVFCSVPDPLQGLREMRRVCRPGGTLLLLEHMRPPGKYLGPVFDSMNPLARRVLGEDINRSTVDTVRSAGWMISQETHLAAGVVRMIEGRSEGRVTTHRL